MVWRRKTKPCGEAEEERAWGYRGRGGGLDGDGGDFGTKEEEGQEGKERVFGKQLFV